MTNNEELIAEARKCAPGDCSTELAVMVHRLADALEAAVPVQGEREVNGSTSDGYHTFDELYEYRMLYNAHASHGWLAAGIPVVKSWKHSDGELCFGGGWFIVTATLPAGQVSNHYKAEHWGLFKVPEVELPPAYDGHTPKAAADRLRIEAELARAVQGESNDDRPFNAKGVIVAAINQVDAKHDLGSGDLASSEEYADAILAAIPCASAPDAATEAIERVREIHYEREHRMLDGTYLGGTVCGGCRLPWPCSTIAALDGAPEPEWEWGVRSPATGNYYPLESEGAARELHADSVNRDLVRRRKAGPWLPVEGESK